ncbi:hypothetical protein JCGZ_02423 [Jatropha curcas]|uniref:Uncharacterized protein n=1 Tax=Jatropha curcas TaxID=180498 RepID=A0A067LF16_JATCU|nr:hypothetical protein JCGZ_02423 [Jatropha curcas]
MCLYSSCIHAEPPLTQPSHRLVRESPIPERALVSSVVSSSSSDSVSDLDPVVVEMADVEEREAPEPALGNQASADNVSPAENDLIKQLAEERSD